MTSYVTPKKNSAFILYVGLPSQANAAVMQSTPTLAAGDFKVSIDGGASANLTTLPTVTPAAGRQVKISLSAAEMNGDNITVQCVDAAGAEWCDVMINIQTTAQQIDDIAGFLDTEIAAIKAKTDNLPSDPADQSALEALIDALPTAAENATQLLDVAAGVETGLTVRQALRLMAAVLYGKGSGLSSTTAAYRDMADTKDRIMSTVDADGNRTNVTRDAT